MTEFDPMRGERLAPAWDAAGALLGDGEWHKRTELVGLMLHVSDLQAATCAGLLHNAVRTGWLERRGTGLGRGNQPDFRVTELGRATRGELR